MSNPKEPLDPDFAYHIYNKTVGNEKLFHEPRNYLFFLDKFEKWILPVCDPYAWCLMPNHFHFVLRIKEPDNLLFLRSNPRSKSKTFSELVNEQFSHCFNSYAQAYNKAYKRGGALFKHNFQRKPILSDEYLQSAINYLHLNPVKAGLVRNLQDWKYSSYPDYIGKSSNPERAISKALKIDEEIEIFGSLKSIELLAGGIDPTPQGF